MSGARILSDGIDPGRLLAGEAAALRSWTEPAGAIRPLAAVGVILVGAGIYGAAMGSWRGPEQAWFSAVKFPLVLLLVATLNAGLNGLLAPLLGLDLRFRQSLAAILLSFAVASAILGSLAPVAWFLTWNAPGPEAGGASLSFSALKLGHTLAIAFAGVTGNVRLWQLLRDRAHGDRRLAGTVLCAWLAGNLLLGSQLCWILRPFFGSPALEIRFLRQDAFDGNFFETLFDALRTALQFS